MSATTTLANPLAEGLRRELTTEPAVVVIFGATGDLTKRKLLPALYALSLEDHLPSRFAVVGVGRKPMDDDAFREYARHAVREHGREAPEGRPWDAFAEGLSFFAGDLTATDTFRELGERLAQVDRDRGTAGNRVFYLSVPPSVFPPLLRQLEAAGLVQRGDAPFTRVVIEKPFGHDLESARALNREVQETLDEEQTYRMDHYLGKETVQNLFMFRFANSLFEPIWNRNYVDHVQITVAESIGMEGRGRFFEEAGITRDIIQNHMLQLLSLVAMEPPASFRAEEVRDEKVKVLRSVRAVSADRIEATSVRGQYTNGTVAGKEVAGYRDEDGVDPRSTVETFAALALEIETWRWAGVPFFVRAGKRLSKRVTEIAVVFRPVPHLPFDDHSVVSAPNALLLRIQPDEGISLRFEAKVPGPRLDLQSVKMDFLYGTSFGRRSPEAYERLLLDCLLGDPTLFARSDEVEAAWGIVMPYLERWAERGERGLDSYPAGSWGPERADELLGDGDRAWRRP